MTTFKWVNNCKDVELQSSYKRWTQFGVLTIPAGFVSDGASIPWWVYLIPGMAILFQRWDAHLWAVVVHDYLYRKQPEGWTRKMADVAMLDIMREDDVTDWKARTMYRAVRTGALFVWRRYRKETI